MKLALPIKVEVTGRVTLGPVPGTPEFEEEQRQKREKQNGDAQHGSEKRSD